MRVEQRKFQQWVVKICAYSTLSLFVVLIGGCADPVARQEVLTFFFDGVPALPSLDELCEENMEQLFDDYFIARLVEADQVDIGTQSREGGQQGSVHRPFENKDCKGCHDFKKSNLLITEREEDLCYVCHKDFLKGPIVHGPVAVQDCLACHVPHDSKYVSLLQKSRNDICSKCHWEKRLAENMHDKVVAKGMLCVDCHDAHSGNVHYFLK